MTLIAGPCVIESKEILKQSVEAILESIRGFDIDFYFKASFRKDNRTVVENFAGLDEEFAISCLKEIKDEYGVGICTDFHNSKQLKYVDKYDIDVVQIPAFLAKQQSLLKDMAETKKILHIKKPQFIGPEEALSVIKNAKDFGAENIIFTDRGTVLGYNQFFVDPRHISILKESGVKILNDITHPNKNYPGDLYKNIESIAKMSIVNGSDGVFLETHPMCEDALCDGQTMLPAKKLKKLIKDLYLLKEFVNENYS